jgi:hypothetical protein
MPITIQPCKAFGSSIFIAAREKAAAYELYGRVPEQGAGQARMNQPRF